jgi:hypothetical protein
MRLLYHTTTHTVSFESSMNILSLTTLSSQYITNKLTNSMELRTTREATRC